MWGGSELRDGSGVSVSEEGRESPGRSGYTNRGGAGRSRNVLEGVEMEKNVHADVRLESFASFFWSREERFVCAGWP